VSGGGVSERRGAGSPRSSERGPSGPARSAESGEGVSRWEDWAASETAGIRAAGQWRRPRDLDAAGPEGKLAPDGRPVVSFASNDYLGLTQHPAVVRAAHAALDRWGAGSGSARLIVGSRPIHSELEHELAVWKGAERAVLFPTGFAANLGVLTALGGPDTVICSDALNHASIIDGCRMARAHVAVYRHGDVGHVGALLAEHAGSGRRAIVVTDTVFSMDGDVAPVDELADLCAREGALLVLDEAHAVLGPDPRLDGLDALRVGTLSKTLGSLGGFVAGPSSLTDLVVNRARSYIFTTASTPADAAAARAALDVVRSPEGDTLRNRLRAHVERIRPGHPSPIVPVLFGDEERTLAAAAELLELGLLVPAIRPPTVPPGTSRLRVALSAAHTDEQVDALARALARW
jgi:8-amino-7-oxononanoate synthase